MTSLNSARTICADMSACHATLTRNLAAPAGTRESRSPEQSLQHGRNTAFSLFVLQTKSATALNRSSHLSLSGVNLRPGDLVPPPATRRKNDSEINKFGPASGAAGVPCVIMTWCPMDSSR